MPRRPTLLVLAVLVASGLLGGVVLLLEDGTDGGRAGEARVTAPDVDGPGPAPELPSAGREGAPATALLPDGPPAPEVDEVPDAPRLLADGGVTGRVVDPSGAPVADVPVLLYVTEDPWQPTLGEGETVSVKLGAARTDGSGAFALPARAGASHVLLAGGVRWARVRLDRVAAGDELLVELVDPLRVEGVVEEEETGEPIEGARVLVLAEAESLNTATDADGAFRVEPVDTGTVTVVAWAAGYDIAVEQGVPPGWEPVTLALPAGRDLVGRVLERETHEPLAGAEVRLVMDVEARAVGGPTDDAATTADAALETEREVVHELVAVTDVDGAFLLEGVPSLGFVLHVTAEGHVPERVARFEERPLREDEEAVVYLEPVGEVTGRVVAGPDLLPVPGAQVAFHAGRDVLATAVADDAGAFAFGLGDWDGEADLVVWGADAEGRRGRARVRRRHKDEELVVSLVEPVAIEVRVVDDGEPIAGAQVAAHGGFPGEEPTLVVTDADGAASLVHPLVGPDADRLFVQARHAGRQSLPLELDFVLGAPTEPVVLDLATGVHLEGVVLDPAGAPVAGAEVWGRGALAVHSDPDGRFRIGPFEQGRSVRIEAHADGFHETRHRVSSADPWTGEIVLVLEPVVTWEGLVVDATTGLPKEDFLARLQVEEDGRNGPVFRDVGAPGERRADDPGAFVLELPAPGRFRVKIMSLDCIEATSLPADFDGVSAPLPVQVLVSPAAVLRVHVEDAGGRPVHGFNIRLVDEADFRERGGRARRDGPSRRTDSDGVAGFNMGAGGAYFLASGSSGWLEPDPLLVTPGPPVVHRIRLPATGDLAVRVTDEQGLPVERPRVTLRSRGRERAYEVLRRSSPRGAPEEVVFEVLPPGEYTLHVRARGFAAVGTRTIVVANRLQHESVVLRPPTPEELRQSSRRGGRSGDVRGMR